MPKKQEYEVEAIIGKRRKKNTGTVEYRVLWKGYSKDEATWEPEEHLDNVDYMIQEFNQKVEARNNSLGTQKKPVSPPPVQIPQTPKQKELPKKSNQLIKQSDKTEKTFPQQKNLKKPVQSQIQIQQDDQLPGKTIKNTNVNPKANITPIVRKSIPDKPVERKLLTVTRPPQTKPIETKPKMIPTVPKPMEQVNGLKKPQNGLKKVIQDQKTMLSDEQTQAPGMYEIIGMYQKQNSKGNYMFAAIDLKSKKQMHLDKKIILKNDPKALIKYYQQSMQIV